MNRQMYQFILYDLEQVENIISCFDKKATNGIETYIGYKYAFILHDKDITSTKEIKKAHYHLVVKFTKKKESDELLNLIKDYLPNHIHEDINKANAGSWAYLIHANALNKFQYEFNEVTCNFNRDDLYDLIESHRIIPSEIKMACKGKELFLYLLDNPNLTDYYSLIESLVFSDKNELLGWVAKNSYFVNSLLAHNLKKKRGGFND